MLLEGEEREYFLELLMRKESPEKPEEDRPVEATEDRKGKAASVKSKDKKKDRKKTHKEGKARTSGQEAGKSAVVQPATWGSRQHLTSSATRRPRAEG